MFDPVLAFVKLDALGDKQLYWGTHPVVESDCDNVEEHTSQKTCEYTSYNNHEESATIKSEHFPLIYRPNKKNFQIYKKSSLKISYRLLKKFKLSQITKIFKLNGKTFLLSFKKEVLYILKKEILFEINFGSKIKNFLINNPKKI